MKKLKYFTLFTLFLCAAAGCKKDQSITDTSFVSTAASVSSPSVMFNITHDNTGAVTITPGATGATSYDVYFGDGNTTPTKLAAGQSIKHTYAEGSYQVKLVAHDIKGGTATVTQPLVVSFLAPLNLAVNLTVANLTATVSATAKYATLFKISFGDSTAANPVPSTFALGGQAINHAYKSAGTYVVTVTALSGGAETTVKTNTISISNPITLPVTFDDPNTTYTMSDFGGDVSTLSVDPTNSSNHVMKTVKTPGAQVWAGTTIGTGSGFPTPIPITALADKMTMQIYSPGPGLDIKMKLDNHANANNGVSVETDVLTTKTNQWETLTFDFSKNAAGTPAFSASNTYDLISIFFDFGNGGSGTTFYFDNVQMATAAVIKQIDLPVTFEDPSTDYTMVDFGGNVSTLVVDPANANNHVMQSVKTNGAQTYAGTTMGPSGFATVIPISSSRMKMTVDVYSPGPGFDVKLKLDNHTNSNSGLSVETDVLTTKTNQWETLTFDFSKNAAGTPAFNSANTYDLATIFFDFGNTGNGGKFYWDNVILL